MGDVGKSPYVRSNDGENEAPSAKPIQDAIIITDVTGFEEPETRSGHVVYVDQSTPRRKGRNTSQRMGCGVSS